MPELSETSACLRIFGTDLEPGEVTSLLGKSPDFAERRGAVSLGQRTRRERIARGGIWIVKVARRSPGDLDRQIAEVLQGTTDDLRIWQNLTSRFKADIFCGLFLGEVNQGASVSPATLKMVSDRGLHLELDIYSDYF